VPAAQDTHSGLLRKLEREAGATPGQLALVDRCCRAYEQAGVIEDDLAHPLHDACPAKDHCWEAFPATARPEQGEAEISVPWIGPGYKDHRLCAVAINQNEYGGLGAHWWIVGGRLEDLDRGTKPDFHYPVGRYMAAVLASLDGIPVLSNDELDTGAAADAWRRCCFTEAIKCSPLGERSRPSDAMWHNCPSRFLLAELAILQPRTLIVVGRDTGDALRQLFRWEDTTYGPSFSRARALFGSVRVEGFFLNHPAYGHWRRSLESLQTSLRDQGAVHLGD